MVAMQELPAARWTAVVINFNAGDELARCVASIEADTSAGVPEIIVVDNGSTDTSLESIRTTSARVVHSPSNVGYSRAANLGIAAARGVHVAVLNADLVLEAGTAGAMCAVLDRDIRVAAVGPRLRNSDGTDYPSAREVPGMFTSLVHLVLVPVWPSNPWSRRYRQEHLPFDVARDTDWLSGAAMWLRRDALDDVGGWDERYFMFLEDVDLCVRLRNAGWLVRYDPSGVVVHTVGVSRRTRPYSSIIDHHRGAFRFATTHWSGFRRLLLGPLAVALTLRAAALCAAAFVRRSRPRLRRAVR